MKPILRAARALWVIVAALLASPVLAHEPIVLSDAANQELRLAAPPKRIVSLLPSLTESVCELGECARLVATDRYSNWPESVQALPKAGGLEDVQVEQIVRAQPDIVLLIHCLLYTSDAADE